MRHRKKKLAYNLHQAVEQIPSLSQPWMMLKGPKKGGNPRVRFLEGALLPSYTVDG